MASDEWIEWIFQIWMFWFSYEQMRIYVQKTNVYKWMWSPNTDLAVAYGLQMAKYFQIKFNCDKMTSQGSSQYLLRSTQW